MDKVNELKLSLQEIRQDFENFFFSKSKFLFDKYAETYPQESSINYLSLDKYLESTDRVLTEVFKRDFAKKLNTINNLILKNDCKKLIDSCKQEIENLMIARSNKKLQTTKLKETNSNANEVNSTKTNFDVDKITKINYGKNFFFLGEVQSFSKEDDILTRNGKGVLFHQDKIYFCGEFEKDHYKSGILYDVEKNEIYFGNFNYTVNPISDPKHEFNNLNLPGYYYFSGIKVEDFHLESYRIFIGEFYDVNELLYLNSNLKGITIELSKSKLDKALLSYIGSEYDLNFDYLNDTVEITKTGLKYIHRLNTFVLLLENNKKTNKESVISKVFKSKSSKELRKLNDLLPKNLKAESLMNNLSGKTDSSFKVEKEAENFEIYNGELNFTTFLPDGLGVFYFSNKQNIPEYFKGNFSNGICEKNCKYIYESAVILDGQFVNNQISQGKFCDINGKRVFEGSFVDGLPKQGTIYFDNGDTFYGLVNDDFTKKEGTYTDIEGNSLKISYEKGAKNGKGEMKCKNSVGQFVKYEVKYEKDDLLEVDILESK